MIGAVVFKSSGHPRYARGGTLVLSYGCVAFPEVMELTAKLDRSRYVLRDFTLRYDLREFTVGSRRELLVKEDGDAVDVAGWITGLPHGRLAIVFEELSSPASFVAWARGDPSGITIDNDDWIAVAATRVWLGYPVAALAVLEAHIDLSDPTNKKYSEAFEEVRSAAYDAVSTSLVWKFRADRQGVATRYR